MKQYSIYLMDADDTLFDFQKAERCAFFKTFEALSGQACTQEIYAKYSQLNRSLWEALERREITKPQLQETRFGLFLKEQGLSGDGLVWNETYLDAGSFPKRRPFTLPPTALPGSRKNGCGIRQSRPTSGEFSFPRKPERKSPAQFILTM